MLRERRQDDAWQMRRPLLLSILTATGLLAFWIFLIFRGFPFPNVDDCPYVGPALSLANGHGLTNPLLGQQGPFYYYPPIYFYLLAGWLKLWGISAASVVLYYGIACWLTTWCVIRTFQITGLETTGWLTVLALVVYFTCVGLRPDVTSLLFLSLSLRCGISPRPRLRTLSPTLAILSIATLPGSLALALPWLIYLLKTDRKLWRASVIGGLGVAALVLLLVHGQGWELWEGLQANSHLSRDHQLSWIAANWDKPQGLIKSAFPVLVCALFVGVCARTRGLLWIDLLFILGTVLGLYASTMSISGQRSLAVVTVVGAAYYLETGKPARPWKQILILAIVGVLVGAEPRHLLQGITTEKPSPQQAAQLRTEAEHLHPSRLIIDEWSLRYVFDFQPSPNMLLLVLGQGDRPESHLSGIQKKLPDECWLLSAESVRLNSLAEPGLPIPSLLTLGGHPIGNWVTNAGELGLLPPAP